VAAAARRRLVRDSLLARQEGPVVAGEFPNSITRYTQVVVVVVVLSVAQAGLGAEVLGLPAGQLRTPLLAQQMPEAAVVVVEHQQRF
jgi:hypothetical protein